MERIRSSAGVELALHDLGGRGPALLLAHATGFHGRVFEPLVRSLNEGDRPLAHAWAPDLRGHGSSTAMADLDYRWEGFADDVLAVADALAERTGDGPLVGFGHSKGGASLLLAEARRPGTFRAIYAYEPVVFPPDLVAGASGGNHLADGAERRRQRFADRDAAYANFAAKPPLSVLDPEALRAYVDHGFADDPDGGVVLRCRPAHEAQVYRMGSKHPAWSRLPEVGCPVVVARGEPPEPGPAMVAEALVERLPHGRLQVFEGLGHFGPLQDPARVAADLAPLLAGA